MGKKNLDQLFQEKLKDFSEVPDEKVWQSIETALDKKKKSRKAIPIWWKLGGVAALVLIAITLINPFDEGAGQVPAVTEVDRAVDSTSKEIENGQTHETPGEDEIVDVEGATQSDRIDAAVEKIADTDTPPQNVTNDRRIQESVESVEQDAFNKRDAVAAAAASAARTKADRAIAPNAGTIPEKGVADRTRGAVDPEARATKDAIAEQTDAERPVLNEGRLLNNLEKQVNEGIAEKSEAELKTAKQTSEAKKQSILDAIAEQQDEEVVEADTGGKWSAGPSVAPVYYDAIGEGSPVHSIFVPNSKSGDLNLSYGLSVAYEVSKKLSIRSGLHKVDYGYRTNDVEFSSSLESASNGQIDNIDYTITSKNLVVSSKVSTRIEALNQNPFLDTSSDVSAASAAREGTMEQQFGYLEVPLELNYALVDNRFGVNLIGGISSLFLIDNSISLNSGDLTTEMGEANNVNSVNFSTNVGFGVNYKFTPKVQLNIEPVFKYQLNTFSETDGTFNPFSVGVYSGLSFKF